MTIQIKTKWLSFFPKVVKKLTTHQSTVTSTNFLVNLNIISMILEFNHNRKYSEHCVGLILVWNYTNVNLERWPTGTEPIRISMQKPVRSQ